MKDWLKHGLNFLSLKSCSPKPADQTSLPPAPSSLCHRTGSSSQALPPAKVTMSTSEMFEEVCCDSPARQRVHGSTINLLLFLFSPPSSSPDQKTRPCDLWRSVIGWQRRCCGLPTFMDFLHSCILKLLAWLLSILQMSPIWRSFSGRNRSESLCGWCAVGGGG